MSENEVDRTTAANTALAPSDDRVVEELGAARARIEEEVRKRIVGMERVIEEAMIALFAQGHCLLVGVPGLAKTLLVSSLAQALSLDFRRIQFTPDLMPSDITGTEILYDDPETRQRSFKFVHGPVFANVLLADEINRTPPKTQAALLQAMQERKVSCGGTDFALPSPFMVLATQNPIEQEGTYPLPEAQLDRFFFNILVDYPSCDEEIAIVKQETGVAGGAIEPVLGAEQILSLQALVRRMPAADHVVEYAVNLARATRPKSSEAPDFITERVVWGVGPRASLYLVLAGKARAALRGSLHVAVSDIRAVALPVLRHRMSLTFAAHAEGITCDDIVKQLLEALPSDERMYQ